MRCIDRSPRPGRLRPSPTRRGFTLIEIAVALGIVALMTAILLPVVADRLKAAGASRAAVQLDNVRSAARTFYLDVGSWPGQLSQLADAPGTGSAGVRDVFGGVIPRGDASGWDGPYLNVAELPGDSLDMGDNGVIVSPFAVTRWAGDDFLTIPVADVSRSTAERVSGIVDGDTALALTGDGGGRVRWEDGVMLYLAEPIER